MSDSEGTVRPAEVLVWIPLEANGRKSDLEEVGTKLEK